MKLQLDQGHYRLRLTEDDLARLIDQGTLLQEWPCPDGAAARCELGLRDDIASADCSGTLMALCLALPRASFETFAAARPRRDGFSFQARGVEVIVDVDVRDSRRSLIQVNDRGRAGPETAEANAREPPT
ncbi:MAG: hypothetical protein JNN30_19880 [Rhodanobacteraceae bacterium]|nr:hypothetical protein [Rhodanobacteraceae bacterium]